MPKFSESFCVITPIIFAPIIAGAGIFLINLFLNVTFEWFHLDKSNFLLLFLILLCFCGAFCVFQSIYFLFIKKFTKALASLCAVLGIYVVGKYSIFLHLLYLGTPLIIPLDIQPEYLKAHIKDPKFFTCITEALPVAREGVLNVCERHDHDDGFWYTSLPYVTAIIYDSTDEIVLPSKRSEAWILVAQSMDKKAPFGIIGIQQVQKISGHFYNVIFDARSQRGF